MLARTHTAVAIVLIALVPLLPAGMRVYAALASADESSSRAAAERIIAQAPPPPGAHRLDTSGYDRRAWDGGESLVPIKSWWFETAYRLPHALAPVVVARHYEQELSGWRVEDKHADCKTFGQKPGCAARYVTLRRDGWELELNMAEYLDDNGRTVTEYGLTVSQ